MWRRQSNHVEESEELRRARAEKERADQQLQRVQQNGAHVDRISGALTAIIRRNGFGESIELAFQKRRTSQT
jgi:hypothetical protein